MKIKRVEHIAIAVNDVDVAASAYAALLGRSPDWREETAGARHAWFQLTNVALDLVQPDGAGDIAQRPTSAPLNGPVLVALKP